MSAAIPFNKPYVSGKELAYIAQAINAGKISADGHFTKLCAGNRVAVSNPQGAHDALMHGGIGDRGDTLRLA